MFLFAVLDTDEDPAETTASANAKIIERNLRRIARGHQDAIGEIYELTKSSVYGFVLSILKNAEDAEDILQDTYIKICLNADAYVPQGKPMAWIFTIARNLSLMKLRGRKRVEDIPEYEWEQIAAGNTQFRTEDQMVLMAALSKISEQESQIVIMHAVAGMKHREIAEVMEMPLATVLSKYNRAIRKLKAILEEDM